MNKYILVIEKDLSVMKSKKKMHMILLYKDWSVA